MEGATSQEELERSVPTLPVRPILSVARRYWDPVGKGWVYSVRFMPRCEPGPQCQFGESCPYAAKTCLA